MTHTELNQKIQSIRPGARYALVGKTYEGLEWFDESPKPTPEELDLE